MPFLIDAWLERKDPMLRVLDKKTGMVLRQWDAHAIQKWCDSGEICLEDLLRAEPSELKKLVSELFLSGCIEDIYSIRQTFNGGCSGCGRCESKVVHFMPRSTRH
jgi:hypothetical protein